jgi:prevent-host-death family protein
MQTLSIKEARAQFGRLVEEAEKGETVIITRNGKPSARVGPLPSRARALPALGDFRAGLGRPGSGLSETVAASRREERF